MRMEIENGSVCILLQACSIQCRHWKFKNQSFKFPEKNKSFDQKMFSNIVPNNAQKLTKNKLNFNYIWIRAE